MSKESFNSQQAELLTKYNKLRFEQENDTPVLKGDVDIVDKQGKFWETYSIEIRYVEQFPSRFPILFEMGDKIPKIADWHIYENTGACCVTVLPREIIACNQGVTLLSYLDKYALPYLFNQTFRRINGYYPSGEYSHGTDGIIEFYLEQLKTNDVLQALKWIWQISEGLNPSRTSMCFCGKKIKYRYCHREALKTLRLIGAEHLKYHVVEIHTKLNL